MSMFEVNGDGCNETDSYGHQKEVSLFCGEVFHFDLCDNWAWWGLEGGLVWYNWEMMHFETRL